MTHSQMEHLCGKRCTFIKYISTPLSFMTEQRNHIISIYNYTDNEDNERPVSAVHFLCFNRDIINWVLERLALR